MKTGFYNRSLFNIIQEPIPEYYKLLDDEYDKKCSNRLEASLKYLDFSENVCKRHSDVIFYKNIIINQYKNVSLSPYDSAKLISTYLVGYFGAVKSFTDGVSICLNEIFSLDLSPMNRDLCRKPMWNKLEKLDSEDYTVFKSFFEELKDWRNKSSHQLSPIVGVHGSSEARRGKSPNQVNHSDVEIKLANVPGLRNDSILMDFTVVEWISPLKYLNDWNLIINELANSICMDIIKKL
jgi:hypothetical protein